MTDADSFRLLAESMHRMERGQADTNARLEQTNTRLEQTNARLEQLGTRLEQTNATLADVLETLEHMAQIQLELRVGQDKLNEQVDYLSDRVASLSDRVDGVRNAIVRGFTQRDERISELVERIERLERRLDRPERPDVSFLSGLQVFALLARVTRVQSQRASSARPRQVVRALLAVALVLACVPHPGCGARSEMLDAGGGHSAAGPIQTVPGGTGASGGTSGWGGFGARTTSDGGLGDAAPSDDAMPPACAEVGKGPGISTCCDEQYCNGYCDVGESCRCGAMVSGGCIAPEVCCNGGCVGPYYKGCPGALTLEAKYVVVNEGTSCLTPLPKAYALVKQTCCNGKLCQGNCLLFEGKSKPECWCNGLPGGCPSPHVCCHNVSCTNLDSCKEGDNK